MNNSDNRKKLTELREKYESSYAALNKKNSTLSTLRGIVFLLFLGALIVCFSEKSALVAVVAAIFVVIFIILVKTHADYMKKQDIAEGLVAAARDYEGRFGDEWRSFPDDGADFLTKENTVAYDIDLLGHASLFQLINVCHTGLGRQRLAETIMHADECTEDITQIRAAVRELAETPDRLIGFEAIGRLLDKRSKKQKKIDGFVEYCKNDISQLVPGWARLLSMVLPVAELLVIVFCICGRVSVAYVLLGFIILLIYSELTGGLTAPVLTPVRDINASVEDYLDMLGYISETEYNSKPLADLNYKITAANGVLAGFRRLNRVAMAYNIYYNPVLYIVLGSLFQWNYRLADMTVGWHKKYAAQVAEAFSLIAEYEKLCSMAALSVVRTTSDAVIISDDSDSVGYTADALYHPLLMADTVVPNSVSLDGGITIITGSNMSGKTTFLRTLAINLVLAYMGSPVCGRSLSASRMKIFTSMRVMDDVTGGISTFYAEILRIKSMAAYRDENKPMICLVDEIFKGTNSADRIVGATEAIRRLSGGCCMALVSTHDFELCNISDKDGRQCVNYHFEEYYKDDAISFDYRLKSGRCTTTNARQLLRMAGFDVAE